MTARTWIAGLALTLVMPMAGCGNVANNAGNAAGFVGNEVAGDVQQGWNTVGNVTGTRTPQRTGGAQANTGTDVMFGTHSVQVNTAARTLDIVMANQPSTVRDRVGMGRIRGTVTNDYNTMHITVPTGWTVRLLGGSKAGGDSLSLVPYNQVNGGAGSAGAAGFGATGGTNPNSAGWNNTSQYSANKSGVVGKTDNPAPGAQRNEGLTGAAKGVAKGAGTAAGGIVNGVGTAAGGVVNGVGKAAGGVANGVGTTAGGVANGIGKAAGGVAIGVGTAAGGVANGIGKAAGGVANGVGTAANGIANGVNSGPRAASGTAGNLGGVNQSGTHVLHANSAGTYAIVYSHPGQRDKVLDIITIVNGARIPSFSTGGNF